MNAGPATCSRCGVKLIKGINWRLSDVNRHYRCKECKATRERRYYQKNKERIIKYQRQWHQDNKEHKAEYDKQYREANKERISNRKKQHYQNNRRFVERYKRFVGCCWPGCNINDPDMLEMHAPEGHKDRRISLLCPFPRNRLKAEIRHCVCLCANHHRKIGALIRRDELHKIPAGLGHTKTPTNNTKT